MEVRQNPPFKVGTLVRCNCKKESCIPCERSLTGITGKYFGSGRLVYITWNEKYRDGDQIIGDWVLDEVKPTSMAAETLAAPQCCAFCFNIGLPECCLMSGCWNAPQDRDQERVEAETIVLALITCPSSIQK